MKFSANYKVTKEAGSVENVTEIKRGTIAKQLYRTAYVHTKVTQNNV